MSRSKSSLAFQLTNISSDVLEWSLMWLLMAVKFRLVVLNSSQGRVCMMPCLLEYTLTL